MGEADRIVCICYQVALAAPLLGGDSVDDVAASLAGIAAQESSLKYRRQLRFKPTTKTGGFSLWQLEAAAVRAGLLEVQTGKVFGRWKLSRSAAIAAEWLCLRNLDGALLNLQEPAGDMGACILTRLYQLRRGGHLGRTVEMHAAWWKEHHNTIKGRGTLDAYVLHYGQLVAAAVQRAKLRRVAQ